MPSAVARRAAIPYYSVVPDPEPGGGYAAWAPALPDCRARSATIGEAIAAVREVIEACLERMVAEGLPPPEDAAPLVISVEVAAPAERSHHAFPDRRK
jgi:predicted RNase H-like HicB family nuclease